MKSKKQYQQLITPEEAVRIAGKACTASDADLAMKVCETWWSDPIHYERRYEITMQGLMLSAVYTAGRIQGIREERSSRHAATA